MSSEHSKVFIYIICMCLYVMSLMIINYLHDYLYSKGKVNQFADMFFQTNGYVYLYVFNSFLHWFTKIKSGYTYIFAIFFAMYAISLLNSLNLLLKSIRTPILDNKSPLALIDVCSDLIAIWMMSASINYLVYILFPAQFAISDNISVGEATFEFLYYTFTLIVTYSNTETIVALGKFAKSLQMIEILTFYVFIGIFANSYIGKLSDSDNTNKEN